MLLAVRVSCCQAVCSLTSPRCSGNSAVASGGGCRARVYSGVLAAEENRIGDQIHRLLRQLPVIFRVPAVAAHQHAEAASRGLNDLQGKLASVMDVAAYFAVRILLALGLAQYRTVTAEHQAAVEQRAAAGAQHAVIR